MLNDKFILKLVISEKNNDLQEKIKSEFMKKLSEYGFCNYNWDFLFVDIITPQENAQKLNFYYDLSN